MFAFPPVRLIELYPSCYAAGCQLKEWLLLLLWWITVGHQLRLGPNNTYPTETFSLFLPARPTRHYECSSALNTLPKVLNSVRVLIDQFPNKNEDILNKINSYSSKIVFSEERLDFN